MKKFILFIQILFCISLSAQNGPSNPISIRGNGVANASVAFTEINSIWNNQAGLTEIQDFAFMTSAEQTSVNEVYMDNFGAGLAFLTSLGAIGFSFEYYGIFGFNQQKFGLAYARKMSEKLSLGVQFDLLSSRFDLTERSYLFTFEVGIQYELMENFRVGVHFYNPAKLEIIEDEFLPRIYRAGATYTANKSILLHAEVEQHLDFSPIFKGGAEFQLVRELCLRIGVHNNPMGISAGMGYTFKNGIIFELAANYQEEIGFTPSIGLGVDFNKKVKDGQTKI